MPLAGEPAAIAGLCQEVGGGGLARQILDRPAVPSPQQRVLALPDADVFALSDDVLGWAKTFSKKLEPQRERVREVLGILAAVYRDALALRVNAPSEICVSEAHLDALHVLSARLSEQRLLSILETVWDARRQTDANAAMRLVLDNLFSRLGELQAA